MSFEKLPRTERPGYLPNYITKEDVRMYIFGNYIEEPVEVGAEATTKYYTDMLGRILNYRLLRHRAMVRNRHYKVIPRNYKDNPQNRKGRGWN